MKTTDEKMTQKYKAIGLLKKQVKEISQQANEKKLLDLQYIEERINVLARGLGLKAFLD